MSLLKFTLHPTDSLKEIIKKKLEEAIDDKLKKEIAQEVVTDIQINTRRGKGILNGKTIYLEPLKSPETIDHRKYLEKGGNATARPYITNFSNLSMSGQLIDSVGYEIDKGDIVIQAKGQRSNYKKLDGTLSKADPITNEELSAIHHKGSGVNNLPARPFIGLRDEMKSRIIVKIREKLRRGLEIVFKVKTGT